jgi:hypothetical protein
MICRYAAAYLHNDILLPVSALFFFPFSSCSMRSNTPRFTETRFRGPLRPREICSEANSYRQLASPFFSLLTSFLSAAIISASINAFLRGPLFYSQRMAACVLRISIEQIILHFSCGIRLLTILHFIGNQRSMRSLFKRSQKIYD